MTNVDTITDTGKPADERPIDSYDPVPVVVDYLIAVLTGVIGVVLAVVGVGLYTQVDRATIIDVVNEEGVEVEGLTESEFATAGAQFVDWVSVGFVLTGLLAVIGAASFIIVRRRTRRRVDQEGGTTATFWACAVYGGVVTVLVSFIPGSTIAGGGAAAYLHDGDSNIRTGAAAGVVGTVLTIPLVAFLAIGFITGAGAVGELSGGALLAAVVIVAELIALLFNVGAGALGGYLVTRFV